MNLHVHSTARCDEQESIYNLILCNLLKKKALTCAAARDSGVNMSNIITLPRRRRG